MITENGLYEPIGIGDIAERVDCLVEGLGLLSAVLRVIVKELPPDLDAAKFAALGLEHAMKMESYADHIFERMKNGGVL
jgi:hypothetical protein